MSIKTQSGMFRSDYIYNLICTSRYLYKKQSSHLYKLYIWRILDCNC